MLNTGSYVSEDIMFKVSPVLQQWNQWSSYNTTCSFNGHFSSMWQPVHKDYAHITVAHNCYMCDSSLISTFIIRPISEPNLVSYTGSISTI